MQKIIHIINTLLPFGPMDAIGVGVIDFKNDTFSAFEVNTFEGEVEFKSAPSLYFDLASLTKPLTNSLTYFLKPEVFDKDMQLVLNHKGGLPAWGLLAKDNWKELIGNYSIKESATLYSDFSALRVMLELEKKSIDQKNLCQKIWDSKTLFWTDLSPWFQTLQYGFKKGLPNFGEVHDPNAWVLGTFCTHAGLFSTADGLCRTLLNYQKQTDFIAKTKNDLSKHSDRFSFGWDRVVDPENTLAGAGCGKYTFGHLGFTGTSIWIDSDKMVGHIILSNATRNHWFDKENLNEIRRMIGAEVWKRQS